MFRTKGPRDDFKGDIYGDLERLAATTQQHPVAGNHGLIRVPTATAPPHQASGKIRNPFAAKYEDRRIVSTHHLVANRPSDYLDNPHDWLYDPYMVHHYLICNVYDQGLYLHHYTPKDQMILAIWADIIARSGALARIHDQQHWTFPQLTIEVVSEALYFSPSIFDDSGSMHSPNDANLQSAQRRMHQILEVRHELRKALESILPGPCDALFFMNWRPSHRYRLEKSNSKGVNDRGEATDFDGNLVGEAPGPEPGSWNLRATQLLSDFERTADPAKFQALIDQNLFLKQQENGMHSGLGSVHGSTPLAETLSRAFRTIEERYTRNPAVSKPDVVAAPPKSKLFGKSKASTSVPLITLHDVCPYQRPVHMPAKLRIIYDGAPTLLAAGGENISIPAKESDRSKYFKEVFKQIKGQFLQGFETLRVAGYGRDTVSTHMFPVPDVDPDHSTHAKEQAEELQKFNDMLDNDSDIGYDIEVYSLEHLELEQHKEVFEKKDKTLRAELTLGQKYQHKLTDLCLLSGYSDLQKCKTAAEIQRWESRTELEKKLLVFPQQLIQVLTFANKAVGDAADERAKGGLQGGLQRFRTVFDTRLKPDQGFLKNDSLLMLFKPAKEKLEALEAREAFLEKVGFFNFAKLKQRASGHTPGHAWSVNELDPVYWREVISLRPEFNVGPASHAVLGAGGVNSRT